MSTCSSMIYIYIKLAWDLNFGLIKLSIIICIPSHIGKYEI